MPLKRAKPCGAKLADGTACNADPVDGKTRCRLHGGLSTGSKTPEGRKRQSEGAKARWQEIRKAMAMYEAETNSQNEAQT